jgi:23S rRNA (uracil1939-C5)-methyltransferase
MPEITLSIDTLGGLGDGVGRANDKPVYVPKSCAGDLLKVRITSQTKEFDRGEIISIIKAGDARTAAPCQHYDECGGCSLQHLKNEDYKALKEAMVTQAIGYAGFPDAAPIYHYLAANTRRRADFKVTNGKLSYYGLRSNKTVAIKNCLILEPKLQALIEPINRILPHFPHITNLSLTLADSGIDVLLQLAKSDGGIEQYERFMNGLPILRVSVQFPNKAVQLVKQTEVVAMTLGEYQVTLPPTAFLQATAEAQKIITDIVTKATNGVSPIVDLFCGIGTYSFPMSKRARVHSVENDGAMVDHVRSVSPKVSTQKRELFKNPLTVEDLAKFNAAVINPPRAGAKRKPKHLPKAKSKRL